MTPSISVIAHNLRSCHNVGSLLRTCDGLGVDMVYLSGYTPYPMMAGDTRLPHIARKQHLQIHKTALGAEEAGHWQFVPDITTLLDTLRSQGVMIAALEQAVDSQSLPEFSPPNKLALLLGSEVTGLETSLFQLTDVTLEIPMFGRKESFNVVQAASMALYHCRFH